MEVNELLGGLRHSPRSTLARIEPIEDWLTILRYVAPVWCRERPRAIIAAAWDRANRGEPAQDPAVQFADLLDRIGVRLMTGEYSP
jgi:hypothetical protein